MLAYVMLVYGCKEITYTPVVLAQYTIGNGGSCTGAILSGNFMTDTPLTNLNTLTITVAVTTPGPYWITTNTSNGISFSQTSIFSATGSQTVVLNGTGTPIAMDTTVFTLVPKSGQGNSCTFSVPVQSGGPPHYYITCYLNGNYTNFSNSAGAINSSLTGLDINGTDTIINSTNKIDFGISNAGKVTTGNYYDSTITLPAFFNFTDSLGNTWKTDTTFHPAFTISLANVFSGSVQGTFSGMLRNENGIDSISVWNGAFFVPLK